MQTAPEATYAHFAALDIRVGTILEAMALPHARKPAYLLLIDFGPLGVKKSSAQITSLYEANDLVGRQIVAVVNFPPKQIGRHMSECLVLGACEGEDVILVQPERAAANGLKIS